MSIEHEADHSAQNVARASRVRSTRRSLASVVLGFELIVVFLGGLTIFGLNALEPRELGIVIGSSLAALILLALALMRTPLGLPLGWAVQIGMLATAFVLPPLAIAGALFTALWVYCMVVGGRIDRERAAQIAGEYPPGSQASAQQTPNS